MIKNSQYFLHIFELILQFYGLLNLWNLIMYKRQYLSYFGAEIPHSIGWPAGLFLKTYRISRHILLQLFP